MRTEEMRLGNRKVGEGGMRLGSRKRLRALKIGGKRAGRSDGITCEKRVVQNQG